MLAHHFGVSYQAAVYRMKSLRHLSHSDSHKLLEQEGFGRETCYWRCVAVMALSPTPNVTLIRPFRPATTGYVLMEESRLAGM